MHENSTSEAADDRLGYASLMMDILGYDPRFLLTDQTALTDLYDALTLRDGFRSVYPELSQFWKDAISPDEMIDFDPLYRDETIYFVDPAGDVVDQRTTRVPLDRRLAPFIAPLGTGRYRPRDPDMIEIIPVAKPTTYVLGRGRLFFDPISRWGEADTDPAEQLDHYRAKFRIDWPEIDYRGLEERMFKNFMADAIFGTPYMPAEPPEEPKKQNGRSAAYLRHDKTKSHKRRKRK